MSMENQTSECCSLWKKMLTNGFWVVYPIMGVCFLHVFWLLNDRMDEIMYNSVPLHAKPEPFKDIETSKEGAVLKGMDLKLITEPSSDDIAEGKKLYASLCASCHKPDGTGGVAGSRDFTAEVDWKNGREFGPMFKTTQFGLNAMPSFDTQPYDVRVKIIHYIRTFAKYPEIKKEEVTKLDKEFALSQDKIEPHRVPIAVAMQILTTENSEKNAKVKLLATKVKQSKDEGAILLSQFSTNVEKSLMAFSNSNYWHGGVEQFAKFITVNLDGGSLDGSILRLEKGKLEVLFQYLKGIQ